MYTPPAPPPPSPTHPERHERRREGKTGEERRERGWRAKTSSTRPSWRCASSNPPYCNTRDFNQTHCVCPLYSNANMIGKRSMVPRGTVFKSSCENVHFFISAKSREILQCHRFHFCRYTDAMYIFHVCTCLYMFHGKGPAMRPGMVLAFSHLQRSVPSVTKSD
jgi:hypothetical protein